MAVLDDRAFREAIRRNVGHPWPGRYLHDPAADSPRTIIRAARGPTIPPPPPPAPGTPIVGRSYAVSLGLLTLTRKVGVTPRIGFPFQLRKITLVGNGVITEAISYRLFASDDNDTTAVVDPTGDELVFAAGDLVAAEDPGIHAALSLGPVAFEPFIVIAQAGRYLKLKCHNGSAATRYVAAFFDVDQLAV